MSLHAELTELYNGVHNRLYHPVNAVSEGPLILPEPEPEPEPVPVSPQLSTGRPLRDSLRLPVDDMPLSYPPKGSTMGYCMAYVCQEYNLTSDDINGSERHAKVSRPRQQYYWLCYHRTSKSTTQIGRDCGGRDHSTVINGRDVHQRRLDEARLNSEPD